MSSKITIYLMWGSQPARAVVSLCEFLKIPYNVESKKFSDLRQPEYLKINPAGRVPVIYDPENKVYLNESHAIMRYLVATQANNDCIYYPQDPVKRAQIDAYLDWHHTGARQCAMLVFTLVFGPMMGRKPLVENIERQRKIIESQLSFIENNYMSDKFILGWENPTLADLSCYCELLGLLFIEYNFNKYPKIQNWMKKMGEFQAIQNSHTN
ncbi:Thioredoxin-like fold [Pseudocohnilembus persalinus]|uniref:Thioredoxin-like fold n=1 Tax=Pseudocohnilembus persalinus TaxID=266149 RepID=A0A0V0R7V1_PSEPJ|nr:Thioredoxin-like fold [Pseudocohnilembus persalinus]|eukprot:KRX10572.1 Thioredoxin-like fold [Pseudocohnilembus persalinus]